MGDVLVIEHKASSWLTHEFRDSFHLCLFLCVPQRSEVWKLLGNQGDQDRVPAAIDIKKNF